MKLREIIKHKVLIRESIIFILINVFFLTLFALVIWGECKEPTPQHLEITSTPADTSSVEPFPLNSNYLPTKN